jgi:DeoR/GlpR family transcriptional regulator of sugar metabolism
MEPAPDASSRGEGVPLSQLAADADVSERTIQRDFDILQELGFVQAMTGDHFSLLKKGDERKGISRQNYWESIVLRNRWAGG